MLPRNEHGSYMDSLCLVNSYTLRPRRVSLEATETRYCCQPILCSDSTAHSAPQAMLKASTWSAKLIYWASRVWRKAAASLRMCILAEMRLLSSSSSLSCACTQR